jgi:hypothetical protein
MAASPSKDKKIFVVENYPKKIGKLPSNMSEVPCCATHHS